MGRNGSLSSLGGGTRIWQLDGRQGWRRLCREKMGLLFSHFTKAISHIPLTDLQFNHRLLKNPSFLPSGSLVTEIEVGGPRTHADSCLVLSSPCLLEDWMSPTETPPYP